MEICILDTKGYFKFGSLALNEFYGANRKIVTIFTENSDTLFHSLFRFPTIKKAWPYQMLKRFSINEKKKGQKGPLQKVFLSFWSESAREKGNIKNSSHSKQKFSRTICRRFSYLTSPTNLDFHFEKGKSVQQVNKMARRPTRSRKFFFKFKIQKKLSPEIFHSFLETPLKFHNLIFLKIFVTFLTKPPQNFRKFDSDLKIFSILLRKFCEFSSDF